MMKLLFQKEFVRNRFSKTVYAAGAIRVDDRCFDQ